MSSCSCRAFVAVATTTLRPETSAGIEVREALPGARARFGQQVLARFERVGHRLGELGLFCPRLVARQRFGEDAARTEHSGAKTSSMRASVWLAAAVAGETFARSAVFSLGGPLTTPARGS